jgi:hypothetical protein
MLNATPITRDDIFLDPRELKLDLQNPRMPDSHFNDELEAILYLVDNADVSELVQSITTSGWFDYEPLIVLRDSRIVVEGNRRMAALRIIASPDLQAESGISIPDDAAPYPDQVRVRLVESKREARSFIGFKHINGAFKWDSLAKARFAADWLADERDVKKVSQELGDNHNTILRLVNGWRVLEQAEDEGLFDRSKSDKRVFAFSHLYTGLTRPGMRDYLGLEAGEDGLLPEKPVRQAKYQELRRVTSWLYGQPNEPSIIRSQNPDLKRLVEVLANPRALSTLERTRDLVKSYDEAEDKTARFAEIVYGVIDDLEQALVLASQGYDGDSEVRKTVGDIFRTARGINLLVKQYDEQQAAALRGDDEEDD